MYAHLSMSFDFLFLKNKWNNTWNFIWLSQRLVNDCTHLAQFGQAKAWPIYAYFGNQSKYTHCKPSTHSAQIVGYVPPVSNSFISFESESYYIYTASWLIRWGSKSVWCLTHTCTPCSLSAWAIPRSLASSVRSRVLSDIWAWYHCDLWGSGDSSGLPSDIHIFSWLSGKVRGNTIIVWPLPEDVNLTGSWLQQFVTWDAVHVHDARSIKLTSQLLERLSTLILASHESNVMMTISELLCRQHMKISTVEVMHLAAGQPLSDSWRRNLWFQLWCVIQYSAFTI